MFRHPSKGGGAVHPASPKKAETTGLKNRHYKAEVPGTPRKERGESPQTGAKPGRYKIEDRAARSSRESGVKPPHSKGARLRKRPLQTHGQKRPRRSVAATKE